MFYFQYQMKIELIPYIEVEILQFLKFARQNINQDNVQKMHTIFVKKIKQIDQFHYANWSDFRINLILKSRNMLTSFLQKNKYFLQSIRLPEISTQTNFIHHTIDNQINQILKSPQFKYSKEKQKGQGTIQKKKIKESSQNKMKVKTTSNQKVIENKISNINDRKKSQRVNEAQKTSKMKDTLKKSQSKSVNKQSKIKGIKIPQHLRKQQIEQQTQSPYGPKMTKQQYIAYLKNKSTS